MARRKGQVHGIFLLQRKDNESCYTGPSTGSRVWLRFHRAGKGMRRRSELDAQDIIEWELGLKGSGSRRRPEFKSSNEDCHMCCVRWH